MEKLYNRIDWHNNTSPDINETNLNRMSKALDDLDDRVVLIAGNILVTVPELQEMLEDCTELEQRLEAMTENPPYIGENGHWYIWDTDTGEYVDSGIDASITVEIADITMLEPNATPYVTNTGTDTDPIFHLFIPRGQPGKGISSIAKTGTSGYVDTYTITYTDNTSTTYTVTNGRNTDQETTIPTASAALVGTIYQYIGESTSSYTHGFYYECVNDGGVYKWVNIPVGNDPVALTSTDPYTYRQGKGNLADMEIVGASVGWNQYIPTKSTTTVNGITFTVDNTAHTITISGTASANANLVFYPDSVANGFKGVTGHKYLYIVNNKGLTDASITYRFVANGGFEHTASLTSTTNANVANCVDATKGAGILLRVTSGTNCTTPVVVYYPNLIDLTLLFGSTIADAIYAMETATAGAGVAFFRKYFGKDYYAYDVGSIQSVCVGSRKVVGKNQWNEQTESGYYNRTGKASGSGWKRSDDYIKVVGGQTYILSGEIVTSGNYTSNGIAYYTNDGEYISVDTYDITAKTFSKTFITPSNCGKIGIYVRSGVDFVSAQLELGTTATPYKPYTSTAYPFDSTKELRGMFSLVSGELKANGDKWRGDKIQRNWLEPIDLGSLTWDYVSSADRVWFVSSTTNAKASTTNIISTKYDVSTTAEMIADTSLNNVIAIGATTKIVIRDLAYSDAATFKTAMSGVYLIAEAATPTTETAQPYQNPQRTYIDGTEEFTDGLTRDVMIPVGNNTTYQQDKILPSVEDYVDAVAEVVAEPIPGLIDNALDRGAVNLAPNTAVTTVSGGAIFTVNNDGIVSVHTSGTAIASATYLTTYLMTGSEDFIGKKVKIVGCPKGGNSDGYMISVYRAESASGASGTVYDYGDGREFTWLNNGTGTKAQIRVYLTAGVSIPSNAPLLFKPMLALADMPNVDYDHYVPYAKSNRELTEDIKKTFTTEEEKENVDLDTLTTPGMYFVKNSNDGNYNYPSPVTSGVLTVIHYKQGGETMIRQELQSVNYLCYRNGMRLNGSWVFGAGWFVFVGQL